MSEFLRELQELRDNDFNVIYKNFVKELKRRIIEDPGRLEYAVKTSYSIEIDKEILIRLTEEGLLVKTTSFGLCVEIPY